MTVRELLERIESRELSEWQAYYQVEPFGQEREDIGHAITAATVANVFGGGKRTFGIADFLPQFGQDEDEGELWQQQLAMVEMLNAAFGGEDTRT